jgi:hypothetical protein
VRAGNVWIGLVVALGGCGSDSKPRDVAYDMTDGDSIRFLLGPSGISSELSQIEAGAKVGEAWTYMVIPRSVISPSTMQGTVEANVDGIAVSHEFFGDDPTQSSPTRGDFRIDFTSSPSATTGSITFDRAAGGNVYLDVTYSGTSTVYGPPTYIVFEVATGYPLN